MRKTAWRRYKAVLIKPRRRCSAAHGRIGLQFALNSFLMFIARHGPDWRASRWHCQTSAASKEPYQVAKAALVSGFYCARRRFKNAANTGETCLRDG
jgi:hypothetical protein